MKAFLLELKSIVKNFRFWALIILLICLHAMLIVQFQNEKAAQHHFTIRTNSRYLNSNQEWVDFWGRQNRYLEEHGVPRSIYPPETIVNDLKWYQYELDLAHEIIQAYADKDWAAYDRGLAKKAFLEWKLYLMFAAPMGPEEPAKKDNVTPEEYFGDKWAEISEILAVPDFQQPPWFFPRRITMSRDKAIYVTEHYLALAAKNMPPPSPADTSPWSYTFNFLRRGLPNILGIIILLMTVNLLHRDRSFGSIKPALQIPNKRSRYLLKKLSLGLVASSLIVAIPQFLTFILLGFKNGFKGLSTPVLLTKNFLTLSLSKDEIFELRDFPMFQGIGLSKYTISWLSGRNLLESMEFIPLWQFLLLAAVTLLLFALFSTVLALIISVIFKNEILAQVVAVGVFVLGSTFNRIFPKLKTSALDLFTKAGVIPMLEGSHCSTYLSSNIALLVAIILLFSLSVLIFRRQDVK